MNFLWRCIKKNKFKQKNSYIIFIILNMLMWSLLGFLVWLAIQCIALKSITWAICFAGYPGYFMGFIGGVLFLWKND